MHRRSRWQLADAAGIREVFMPRVTAFGFVFVLTCCAAQAQSPAPAAPEKQTFGMFLRDLGQDFRHLPSLQTGIILGIGGGLATAVHGEDAEITKRWAASGILDAVFEAVGTLGGVGVQLGGAVGTYALSRAIGNPRAALLGVDLVRGQI